jgi:hypothetical protein
VSLALQGLIRDVIEMVAKRHRRRYPISSEHA